MNSLAQSSLVNARGSWASLLKHQKVFNSCDDGVLGEGYSEAVVNLFARDWGKFDEFAALARRDPEFERWVLRHVDATTDDADLNSIVVNATDCRTAAEFKRLCKTVGQAASQALAESKRARQQN